MDRSDASALADLQMHWDEAYTIGLDGDIWSARFHGSPDELRAHTSTELRELIRADYMYRQRARRAPLGRVNDESLDDLTDDLDDDLDDDAYEAHFDSTGIGAARTGSAARGADPSGHPSGPSGPASPHVSFADIRGERMST